MDTKVLLERLVESVRAGDRFDASFLTEDSAAGSAIPAGDLTLIQRWTAKEIDTEQIQTYPILMIDTAPTRNMVIYTAESQKKTVKKWAGTPFLFNAEGNAGLWDAGPDHKLQAASQYGRLYKAKLVTTPKGETGTLGWMYTVAGISQEIDAFIGKLNSGILREVSIHVQVPGGVQCSLCNAPFSQCFENSKTDHYPGEKYGKKMCYMSTGTEGLGPLELSSVACPGSVNAHVMQDDDVENYTPVSLREALGGSAKAIHQIQQENNMRTKEQIAEARTKLAEAAKSAGVILKEFIVDDKNKQLVEDADVTVETVEALFPEIKPVPENATCEKCKVEHVATEAHTCKEEVKPAVAVRHSLVGDTEECVVCKRGPVVQTEDTAQVATVRAEFQQTVAALVEKSEAAVNAANAKAADAEQRAAERDEVVGDLIETVVDLAIKLGGKKSAEKETYRETLATLSYQAVKEIRESLRVHENKDEKTQVTERLETTAAERAKANLGSTVT